MRNFWLSIILVTFASTLGIAQFPEDALRFATPGIGVGARSLGMGNAYIGVASDFSALYWNPAGLAQLVDGEFSLGFSHLNNRDVSAFFNSQRSYSINSTNLNSLGLVMPIPVRRGSATLAFGYHKQSNFTSGLSFEGFNPGSSIIQSYARDGAFYPSNLSNNIAYQLYLANLDTVSKRFISPIKNQVTQLGKVIEDGGLNNWSAGGAFDIARDLSFGATLTYLSGSYGYERTYREQDNIGVYKTFPFDFDELKIEENVKSDISGFGAKLGLMYRQPERFRVGFTVKTPSTLRVRETYGSSIRAYFDNGDVKPTDEPYESEGISEYDVITPWTFAAGGSITIGDLQLSGDIDFTDWTQLKFDNANADLIALNRDMKEIFKATANMRGGAEYNIRSIGLRVRGGFIYNPSPYQDDPAQFDQKYVTGGLGILLSGSTMLDLGYARGWWQTFRINYSNPANPSLVNEKITANNLMLTVSYRY